MASESFQGRHVDDLFSDDRKIGDFVYWVREKDGPIAGLHFWAPETMADDGLALLSVDFAKWKWDGNKNRPTVSPSILHMDGDKWHGYLEAGNFRGV